MNRSDYCGCCKLTEAHVVFANRGGEEIAVFTILVGHATESRGRTDWSKADGGGGNTDGALAHSGVLK